MGVAIEQIKMMGLQVFLLFYLFPNSPIANIRECEIIPVIKQTKIFNPNDRDE